MWLDPIYEELKRRLTRHKVLHADEFRMELLHPEGKRKPVNGYMRTYRMSWKAEPAIIIYEFQPGREWVYPETFLKDWSGYIHAYGYIVYHKLPDAIIMLGRWARMCRCFYKAYDNLKADAKRKGSTAEKGLEYRNALFEIERGIQTFTARERYDTRMERSKPIVDEFFAWVDSLNATPKSDIGARRYTRSCSANT